MRYFLIVLLSIFSFSNAYAENDDEIVDVMQTLEAVNKRIVNINTDELNKILDTDPSVVLIDVRSPFELKHTGTIARGQNVNIVRGWLEFQIGDHAKSKDTPIIVYCGRNLRSPLAAKTLENMGYTNVKNYADGFFVWKEEMNPVKVSDYEPDSILYRLPEEIAPGVYSAIGATQPYTYENSNHNNNLSFIVTTDGVLVFNAGGSYLVAKAMHEEIKKVTDQKVKYVVLENSQGHAILGSNYWKKQGAIIIAHVEADKEIRHRGEDIYARTLRVQKEKIIGTKVVFPDLTFKEKMPISMGDTQIELMHIGASHSPDDIQLWLPEKKLLISELKNRYPERYVIFDTPPSLPFADAQVLAPSVDSTIFVVREGKAKAKDVKEAIRSLHDTNIFGVVYNDVRLYSRRPNYYYYYNHHE
jgi:rhodanese-related sulfurtransferase